MKNFTASSLPNSHGEEEGGPVSLELDENDAFFSFLGFISCRSLLLE